MTAPGWVRAAHRVRRRRLLTAFCAGALGALALPPFYLVFLLIPSVTALVWLIGTASSRRRAFFEAWTWGLGQGVVGYFWIANSLLVDAAAHAWLVPFCVIGIAAILALCPGIAGWVTRIAAFSGEPADGEGIAAERWLAAALVLAGFWTVLEWVRSWLLTGFPWNLTGTVWAFSPWVSQSAAWIGTYGLSFVTILLSGLPAVLAAAWAVGAPPPWVRRVVAGLLLVCVLPFAAGALRLASAPSLEAQPMVPDVVLRLVQPNIAQVDKWKPELRAQHIRHQLRLSVKPLPGAEGEEGPQPTHIIWPETAVPVVLAEQPAVLNAIGQITPKDGVLISGSIRFDRAGGGRPRVFNSLHAVDAHGEIAATYDKAHLVPFGEYVPYQEYLSFMRIASARGNFTPGPGLVSLDLPGLPPVTPLICYEIIFPGAVTPGGEAGRPGWLLNLTNDAWFGQSPGPHQHLAATRMRAIEEGLPIVRVANTGITAVFDGHGRALVRIPLGQEGAADSGLPEALADPPIYASIGSVSPLLLSFIAIGMGIALRIRRNGGPGLTPEDGRD